MVAQPAERHADRGLRRARRHGRQRAGLRARRRDDAGLLADDPARGAVAGRELRGGLPGLLCRGAAPLQLAAAYCRWLFAFLGHGGIGDGSGA